jgi:putative endonuclease
MNDKKLTGRWGETTAAEFLRKKRYDITAMGYQTRFGEIDIIAENRKYIAFVEVKLRKSDKFAQAREFVDSSKQRKLTLTAMQWLQSNPTDKQPRFDVIEIYATEGIFTKSPVINHIENAFEAKK